MRISAVSHSMVAWSRFLVLILLFVIGAVPGLGVRGQGSSAAQPEASQSGSVSGRVMDSSRAFIPGATVILTERSSAVSRTAISNDAGSYEFRAVPPGEYRLQAELTGFKIAVVEFSLGKGEKKVVDLVLEFGDISETIIVSSGGPLQNSVARVVPLSDERRYNPDFNTEAYAHIDENPFVRVSEDPRSTFAMDVDTASYSNVRRFLADGEAPPKDAVRIEELVNYFSYSHNPPRGDLPFEVSFEVAEAPWKLAHRLLAIGIEGRHINLEDRPPGNFVFLIDVSGSMDEPDKLPLLVSALRFLVEQLEARDRVAMAVYAGASGLALPSTAGNQKAQIIKALDDLEAGGSTNGGEGIQLAYKIAEENFQPGGINRVILATDGDFNVGVTNEGDLVRLIEEKAKSNVFLTVLGFGTGNLKDATMEKLADKGNGNYAYIDSMLEARKVLVEEMGANLITIAKDVKIQVEFNPLEVEAYRLIGYENRLLEDRDFNDDKKDAGEIGAGHSLTVLYELVPLGSDVQASSSDPLRYQSGTTATRQALSGELLHFKLRYKEPDSDRSRLIEMPVRDEGLSFGQSSQDFRFAATVAAFGMILRDSPHKGEADYQRVRSWAQASLGTDPGGYRQDFLALVDSARNLPPPE